MSTPLRRSLVGAGLLTVVAACGSLPGLTTPTSTITGTVVRRGAPVPNATVVLHSKVGNQWVDREVGSTSAIGGYTFTSLPPGTYRVSFDRATRAERQNRSVALLQPEGASTFGYLSTDAFALTPGQTRQVTQLDVAWEPSLTPAPGTTAVLPVTFSWHAVPQATGYRVRVANDKNNTLFTSPSLPATMTSYLWTGQLPGGGTISPGTYYWSVNADLPSGFGGTNLSPLTLTP